MDGLIGRLEGSFPPAVSFIIKLVVSAGIRINC
jgi:hypothetical protein